LYPLVPTSTRSHKHAFVTLKPSSSTWHRRLGHPSSFVVQQILRHNNLPHSHEINPYVCVHVKRQKVINCLILFLLVFLPFLWNKFSPMYGVLHLRPLINTHIM
jgi:hypothetical protein